MLKNYLLLLLALMSVQSNVFAQLADIRGKVTDGKENIGVAYLKLFKGDVHVKSLNVSPEGDFIFSELSSGEYIVSVHAMGYEVHTENVYLQARQTQFLKIVLKTKGSSVDTLKGVIVGGIKIDEEKPIDGKKVVQGPYDNFIDVAAMNPKLIKRGESIQLSDARPGQMAIINNGVNQIGPITPRTLGLGQVKVLASGVPAMYGDFLGGAIEYSNTDFLDTVSIKKLLLRSSSPFNAYHHNALETFWYKPLVVRDGKTKLAITHSLFADFKGDPSPTSIDMYKLSNQTYSELLQTPFISAGSNGELPAPNQYTLDDFEKQRSRSNVASNNVFSSLSMAWKPSQDLVVRLTPSIQLTRRNQFTFSNSLLNSDHNPLNTTITGKLNASVLHTLKKPYNKKGEITYDSSLFSKVNYMVIADFQRFNSQTKDPIHGDNIFGYGHIGRFETSGREVYRFVDEAKTVTDQFGNEVVVQGYYDWQGHEDTDVQFFANEDDEVRSSITQHVIDQGGIGSLEDVSQSLGLLNGQNPDAINGMWYAPGTVLSGYNKSDYQKATLNAILNLSMNPNRDLSTQHDIQLGALFEQRKRSFYSLSASSIWQLMPQLLNQQFTDPDTRNPILTYDEKGMFTDTLLYLYQHDNSRQTTFDQNLREIVGEENGYHSGGAHFIDVNSIDPSKLSIDMFSADELWNNGSSYVGYAGYDHTGKLLKGRKGISDFLNDRANRYINGYNPNYAAVWLQDKFVIEKIKIRAGVRVERFDANQLVLKDPYSLYPIKSVSEVSSLAGQQVSHPTAIGQQASVYVNDMNSPTEVVGYREGSTWYDARGVQLSSAESIRRATTLGVIQPYLVDPSNQQISSSSFRDFSPEILVLPRLSFSFPISSKALFYAYYDKFAQRPSFTQSFAPINTYYYLENASTTLLANPALKPSKRTDYQIGYKQSVGRKGILNLTVGYADIKDDINLVSVEQAYPRSYITYGNVDFSTVKKFGADYQINLKNMSFMTNYLLQFADGTGSNANSSAALIQAGQPNLKSLYPLQYDVRHKLNFNASFRLDSLSSKKKSIFRNMSVNMFSNAQSGTPYTATIVATPEAQNLGTTSRSQIKGNPFGSRMPWNYTMDLSISKMLVMRGKPVVLQLNMINLLNLVNVYDVYSATSSANDDGYLASPLGQQQIQREQNAQSFIEYYNLKQNNPSHFGAPRMVSLTVRTTF